MFDIVVRGKLRRLVRRGRDVDMALYACRVERPPFVKHGKTYMELDLSAAAGDLDGLRAADTAIRAAVNPSFSPVRAETRGVIVKLLKTTSYETDQGNPGPAFVPAQNDLVDVVLTPGAFGQFGYCVLVKRMKPHALRRS